MDSNRQVERVRWPQTRNHLRTSTQIFRSLARQKLVEADIRLSRRWFDQ